MVVFVPAVLVAEVEALVVVVVVVVVLVVVIVVVSIFYGFCYCFLHLTQSRIILHCTRILRNYEISAQTLITRERECLKVTS